MLGLVPFQPGRQMGVQIVPDHHDRAAELDVCTDEQVAVVLPGETLIGVATLLLPVLGRWEAGAVILLIVWGVAYGAVPVSSQTWFAQASPNSPEAASVLFTASFQATISIGALVGGVVVDRSSPSTVMVLGSVTAVLMVVVVGVH